ncbi:MAG: preprotein translocase subunit SecA [Armatimonadota bacterium]
MDYTVFSSITNWFDQTKRRVADARSTVREISALRPRMEAMTDAQLQAMTATFKIRLTEGASLDDLLPEAYAVMREAAWRVLGRRQYRVLLGKSDISDPALSEEMIVGAEEREALETRLQQLACPCPYAVEKFMEPFDEQVIGGIILHQGMIAEMKTGEGKTLVAAAPLYLHALTGRGAHLVTVNDYLVRYQGTLMGAVFAFLGLTTGITQAGRGDGELPAFLYDPSAPASLRPVSRHEAYQADILYTTNAELGFDYLRDNMAVDARDLAQRELAFAIVDEVDSILVDEARTPLIISGPGDEPTEVIRQVDRAIRQLRPDVDYRADRKHKNASLTEDGMTRLERALGISNIADAEHLPILQCLTAAVRAHACYHRDVDYVVQEGEVILVDEFTGRLMFGRRYSDGLHQAIEAKEGVTIEHENQTLATITFQNFFRLYETLSGMTGTAKTEEQEFVKIYGLPVAVIPTHRPVIRHDLPDLVYATEEAKLRGIVGEILRCESRQQPVLVGSRSIDMSERLSQRLTPAFLQRYALATVLHRHLLDLCTLTAAQQTVIVTALQTRQGQIARMRDHLETALAKGERYPGLVPPEEERRMEQRFARLTQLTDELDTLHQTVPESTTLTAGYARRIAELLCFQRLDDMKTETLARLLRACGLPEQVTDPAHIDTLAHSIALTTDQERLAMLLRHGVPHQVLNANYHEQEAQIIAQAGQLGAVTIATNMAGRGVDIMLGGAPEGRVSAILTEHGLDAESATPEQQATALAEARRRCQQDRALVVARGGLAIIGTERHESRRIDNQLRGRSGRQGDPGYSRFYVSFDDEVMRLYGPERISLLDRGWPEQEPLTMKAAPKIVEGAQRKVEALHGEMRQQVLKYDDVMNRQRTAIYQRRRMALTGDTVRDTVREALRHTATRCVQQYSGKPSDDVDRDMQPLAQALVERCPQLPRYFPYREMEIAGQGVSDDPQVWWGQFMVVLQRAQYADVLVDDVAEGMTRAYQSRADELGDETLREMERRLLLHIVDRKWLHHLEAMDYLHEGIGLRGYAQMDPLVAYATEAHALWSQLEIDIEEELVTHLFRIALAPDMPAEQHQTWRVSGGRHHRPGPSMNAGRNDPCPCGSGRKFKKCCATETVRRVMGG